MTLNGIDIASYQSEMDVTKVPADFVIVKVSEGISYINPTWQQQAGQVLNSGKLLGLYHYASGGNPSEEATYFVNNTLIYHGQSILVLDFEADAINKWGVNGAKQFLVTVKALTGISPLIYMSASVTRQLDWSSVSSEFGLWVAQYATTHETGFQSDPWCDGKGFGSWGNNIAIHQYTDNLRVNNWTDGLDGNIAYMDKIGWMKYSAANGNSTPSVYSTSGKNLEQMATDTQAGLTGSGTSRQTVLGTYYNGVQAIVNERAKVISANQSHQVLVSETKAGKYGNGDFRKNMLGNYYNVVQKAINNSTPY